MKTTFFKTTLLAFTFIAFSQSACAQWGSDNIKGNGNIKTEKRTVKEYDQIKVSGSFDAFLVAGTEGKITIEAEENLLPYIITENKGSALIIKTENGTNLRPSRNKKILITVPFEDIEEVSLAGSGDVMNKDLITAARFETSVTGSGDVVLEVNADHIEGSVAGSGDLTLKGRAKSVKLQVAGSGDIHASELKTTDAEANVAGSGDIRMYCDGGELKARVSGSGDIRYSGTPSREDTKVSGSGSISN